MPENTSEPESKRWKQQYYDQLDLLDRKEKDWQQLEDILKKTVLRLSIAAEGQHATIDRHLQDIRSVVKKQVDVLRLENVLDDISAVLLKLDNRQGNADRKIISMLMRLLEDIDFPDTSNKKKTSLLKKLSRSTDKDKDALLDEVRSLLSVAISQTGDSHHEQSKPGLLKSLFSSQNKTADIAIANTGKVRADESKTGEDDTGEVTASAALVNGIVRITGALPWPDSLEKEAGKVLKKLSAASLGDSEQYLDKLFLLVTKWQQTAAEKSSQIVDTSDRKQTGLPLAEPPDQPQVSALTAAEQGTNIAQSEPSAQEILIRLLEQLAVPADLHEAVESLKQRIAEEGSTTRWKQLLKDIAQLINTLRNRMQEEKHEFETFLQQITGRLKEMDSFLSLETASLSEAGQAAETFDAVVSAQVQDIHEDMNTADDLNDLKSKVEKRLTVVSDHIKQYRINEQARYSSAQQNVEDMQSRLQRLEQESDDLRKLMLEKNREAMIDVLTEIPNRLAYEKKASEEIARCKRFARPLSMAVWDVDLFKQVNDTYGHKVGDKVLKAIAQLLAERMRETDFIARYGGEEFVMFLPGADESEALEVADALRQKISVCKFNNQGELVKITVSCGISSFSEGDSHESMFERADKALYAAKHNGRNQCLAASSLADAKK